MVSTLVLSMCIFQIFIIENSGMQWNEAERKMKQWASSILFEPFCFAFESDGGGRRKAAGLGEFSTSCPRWRVTSCGTTT